MLRQDPNSNDTRGDSVKSTDSGTCIPTGKGFNYPPLIFTDPEHAANIPDRDIDSITEGPQISSYVGSYCEDCVTKWPRCICKPESDWDDDQNYIVETQMDSPSNVKNDRHPIPSDWSDQENFGMVKHMKSQQVLNVDTGAYQPNKMTMTLTGMTIFTHKITGQKLNYR